LINGNECTDNRKREHIIRDARVFFDDPDRNKDDERVNSDALEPAQYARCEAFDLTKVQTANDGKQGNYPSNIEGVLAKESFHMIILAQLQKLAGMVI
jgi:hypothetical protein